MSQNRARSAVLLLPLFLSGFCGISYEILYARLLSDVIGSHFTVSASILVTFLLGIALGTRFAHRLSGYLWAIEATIGVYAIFFGWLLPKVDSLVFQSAMANNLVGQIAIICLLLIVPSTCVGMTLPLFSGLMRPLVSSRVFGLAYMVYNFGAAFTTLAVEFWLIRSLGIRGTLWSIASINFLVGALLFLARGALRAQPLSGDELRPPRRVAAALILISIASAIFQLFMLKVTQFVYGPFNESFAMLLFVVLLGVALGALFSRIQRIGFTFFLGANIIAMAAMPILFKPIVFLYADHQAAFVGWTLISWRVLILFMLMGPSAICFGAAIPALMGSERHVEKESGYLLSISSLANAAGFLLMVLVVHQTLDYGRTLVLVTGILAVAWVLYQWPRLAAVALAPAVLFLQVPLMSNLWNENLLYGSHTDFEGLRLLKSKLEAPQYTERYRKNDEVLAVRTVNGESSFNLNGYYSISVGGISEHIVGVYSTLVSPRLGDALVLGLGTGSTAGAVAEYFRHADVIEISQVVVDHQDLFSGNSHDLTSKASVDIHCDDAIRYLKRAGGAFDLILNTVTNPHYFSSSKLYTSDFLSLVKRRLRPDGVYTTWIGEGVGNRGLGIIVHTLKEHFRYCWIAVIHSRYWLLLASDAPLELKQEKAVVANPRMSGYFAQHGRNLDLYRYGIVSDDAYGVLKLTGDAPVNTLDRPELEFEMARRSLASRKPPAIIRDYITENYDPDRLNTTVFRSAPIEFSQLALFLSQMGSRTSFSNALMDTAEEYAPGVGERLAGIRLDALKRMSEESPGAGVFWYLGKELYSSRRYEEADAALERCLQSNSEYLEANLYIARSRIAQGRREEARAHLERELQLDPEDKDALKLLQSLPGRP